ncbi:MAG: MJ1477/TM1410 family putative glycoside hydrolase [Patescibacteria group bacterium]
MKKILFLFIILTSTTFFSLPASALDDSALQKADSWVYQLQDASISALINTNYDIVVMDYSKDGTDDEAYTRKQIKRLQNSGKTVLAYFSIGEAEDYRFYWDEAWDTDPPAWLGPENKNWSGNYKVRYWQNDWWDVGISPYLDRIKEAGFDGVYLDIIDGYEYWGNHGQGNKKSAKRMIKLIRKIRVNIDTNNNSIVCPQNGEAIIDEASKKYRKKYWKNINCIGIEDLFFNSSKSDRAYRKKMLKRFSNHDVTILNVEYKKKKKKSDYLTKVRNQKFSVIPYLAKPNRDLDSIN